jgi:hypothetical protein
MILVGTMTALMLALLLSGVWVAASLGLAGAYGLTQLLSFDRMVSIVGKMTWQQGTSFVLVALPLFILMGEMMLQAGIMQRIYNAASKLVAALPGGLLQTNIAASMVFAACTGSSLASAATIGSIGYPTVAGRGYNKPLALGSIAAGGTLGILIPPSIIFIIYGTLAEVSIGKLFLAGVIPGLLLGFVYAVYIAFRAVLDPSLAPREPRSSWAEVGRALVSLWPILVLVVVVLGGIYGGDHVRVRSNGAQADLRGRPHRLSQHRQADQHDPACDHDGEGAVAHAHLQPGRKRDRGMGSKHRRVADAHYSRRAGDLPFAWHVLRRRIDDGHHRPVHRSDHDRRPGRPGLARRAHLHHHRSRAADAARRP